MKEVYSVLVRYGYEWDGQDVFYTKSKALFDTLKTTNKALYYDGGFSDELKQDIINAHNTMDWEMPHAPEPLDESMGLSEAMEYLQEYNISYPIIVLDHTEYTPSWNW